MTTPRLEPVERPSSWLGRLMSFGMRRQLGRVITPALVVYNRVPRMWNVGWALLRLQMQGLRLPQELRLLVQTFVALENGCGFCQDIAKAQAVQARLGLEKFRALGDWRSSPLFDDRERAALAYAEEVNRTRRAADATFDALRKHFGEREIVELTVLVALENFYNLINLPLGIEDDDGLLERALARRP